VLECRGARLLDPTTETHDPKAQRSDSQLVVQTERAALLVAESLPVQKRSEPALIFHDPAPSGRDESRVPAGHAGMVGGNLYVALRRPPDPYRIAAVEAETLGNTVGRRLKRQEHGVITSTRNRIELAGTLSRIRCPRTRRSSPALNQVTE